MTMVNPRLHLSKWLVLTIGIIRTVKTIENLLQSYETGEVIDCVDIFKQPAFDHPLLKNHTMKPSLIRKPNGAGHVDGALSRAWWNYGECPDGTIPILRPRNHTKHHAVPLTPHVKRPNSGGKSIIPPRGHEYAEVSLIGGNYKGARAKINLWNPIVMYPEASFSQTWVTAGSIVLNSVEARWMVDKFLGTGNYLVSFIYWTSDGYQNTGCYNLQCPGFMQTNKRFALGTQLSPVSTYGGKQYEISINITKDDFTGGWWLHFGNTEIGCWPKEIFTSLKGPANQISWGGEILNLKRNGIHTSTQMGSGHFPSEDFRKAAFFCNLKFVDDKSTERDLENLETYVTRSECYDLKLGTDRSSSYGVHSYYGAKGFSLQCAH
ncbi:hypothetical protein BT93_D0703 [Corymbia citriodora subsp. variegata]|nr:hypothetical protein BT93_D0703 [Corymbia citriodora subsp. variegata]